MRPLPLRIEPRQGEAWPGYTLRVADHYRIDHVSLLRPLSDRMTWLRRLRSGDRQALRMAGVAATPQTYQRFATYFNLTVREVQSMHLLAYQGLAVHLDPKDFIDYDPLSSSSGARRALPANVGWVRPRATTVHCPDCVAVDPRRHDLSWWLTLHLVCPEHACFLTAPSEPRTPYQDHRGLSAQASLLRVLRGERVLLHVSAHQTYRQVSAVIEALAAVRYATTPGRVRTLNREVLVGLLSEAWDAVSRPLATGPSASLEELLAMLLGRMKLHRSLKRHECDQTGVAQVLRAASFMRLPDGSHEDNSFAPCITPTPHAVEEVRRLPHLMPLHIYEGALSDLLHDTPTAQGRLAAIVATVMYLTGTSLLGASRALPDHDAFTGRTFARVWDSLQEQGRDEDFWDGARNAAERLIAENINYRHREHLVLNTPLTTRLATATDLDEDTVCAWLSHEWACAPTMLATVPSYAAKSRPAYALRVDTKHGARLRAALATMTSERATA